VKILGWDKHKLFNAEGAEIAEKVGTKLLDSYAQNKTSQTLFGVLRRLLISPPPSAARELL
jgi:hypothetical protein